MSVFFAIFEYDLDFVSTSLSPVAPGVGLCVGSYRKACYSPHGSLCYIYTVCVCASVCVCVRLCRMSCK